jgi:hypothetical protein
MNYVAQRGNVFFNSIRIRFGLGFILPSSIIEVNLTNIKPNLTNRSIQGEDQGIVKKALLLVRLALELVKVGRWIN